MILKWFNIFDLSEFPEDLISKSIQFEFEGIGIKSVLITKAGDLFSVVYEDVILTPNLNERNPFAFSDKAAYVDADQNLWLGLVVDED